MAAFGASLDSELVGSNFITRWGSTAQPAPCFGMSERHLRMSENGPNKWHKGENVGTDPIELLVITWKPERAGPSVTVISFSNPSGIDQTNEDNVVAR